VGQASQPSDRRIEEEDKIVAVKLRLMRMGKKKQPTYRVVAADSRSPRDGRFIEIIGTYQPRQDPSVIKIDNAKAVRWLSLGAQPTETVRKLLRICGAWDEFEAGGAGTPPTIGGQPTSVGSSRAGELVGTGSAGAGTP